MRKTTRDAERLFAAADPAADLDLAAPLAAVRERLAALPDAAAPRGRGRAGLVGRGRGRAARAGLVGRGRGRAARAGLVAAAATVIAVATALLPGRDESSPLGAIPLPVQAFADELSGPGILHVVTKRASAGIGPAVLLPPVRTEGWYALDGSAWRTRRAWTDGGYVEQVFDGRVLREFSSACGLLPRSAAPEARISPAPAEYWPPADIRPGSARMPPPERSDARMPPPISPSPGEILLDLDRELMRGGARVLGRTTVGGAPAYEVAYGPGVGGLSRLDWHLFVSADRAALLQIEAPDRPDAGPMLATRAVSDVPTFEILPATARNAGLLRPAPEFRGPRAPVC
jgi:hypothetical protein